MITARLFAIRHWLFAICFLQPYLQSVIAALHVAYAVHVAYVTTGARDAQSERCTPHTEWFTC